MIPREQLADLVCELRKAVSYASELQDCEVVMPETHPHRQWVEARVLESLERIEAIRSALPQEITCPVR